jgi:hypothetical protein
MWNACSPWMTWDLFLNAEAATAFAPAAPAALLAVLQVAP